MERTMNRLLALLVLGLCCVSLMEAQVEGESVPDTIYAWGEDLQFVSLERAVNSAGHIDTDLLPTFADHLRRTLEQPEGPEGCVESNPEMSTDYPFEDFKDVDASLRFSDHVVIGRVTGLKPGFSFLRLGYLVAIETEEALFGAPNASFYLFFPKGDFEFQGKRYCVTHGAYPDLPAVGDRLLVMHQNQIQGPLLAVFSTQLIVMPQGGEPSIGGSLVKARHGAPKTQLELQTAEEVVAWAKRTLREAGR